MEYSQEDLNALLKAVRDEYHQLKKAEEEKEKEEASASDEDSEKTESKSDKDAEEKLDKTDEPASDDPMPEAPAPEEEAEAAEGAEDPAEDAEGDEQHLHKLYANLEKDQLKEHVMAALAAMFDVLGAASAESEAEQEAPAEAPAEDEGEAPAGMNKSEDYISEEDILEAEKFVKSLEEQIELLKSENALLTEKIGEITNSLAKAMKMPAEREAVESLAKSEVVEKPLTKSEVDELLKAKVEDLSLTDSDRNKINRFIFERKVTQEMRDFLNIK